MPLKTPGFWYRAPSETPALTERALLPLSALYTLGQKTLAFTKKGSEKVSIPVLCVGNAVAGGSGKTPVAIGLHQLIRKTKLAHKPHFLSRGYGGIEKEPMLITPQHSYKLCGDESLLLATHGPTVTARDRYAGARLAIENGADCIVMDDGLQNSRLKKDLGFLVIDGSSGFGNGHILPAGPLREPLDKAFGRAHAFIMIGKDKHNVSAYLPAGKPIFHGHVKAALPDDFDKKKPYVAFAGLGRPAKFYHLLKELGFYVIGWHEFADHHPYRRQDIEKLWDEARSKGAGLITTEKDYMRIKDFRGIEMPQTLKIAVQFDNETGLSDFMTDYIRPARKS